MGDTGTECFHKDLALVDSQELHSDVQCDLPTYLCFVFTGMTVFSLLELARNE